MDDAAPPHEAFLRAQNVYFCVVNQLTHIWEREQQGFSTDAEEKVLQALSSALGLAYGSDLIAGSATVKPTLVA
ncbi:hypothetical protein OPKNFCMD_0985 [Methylobacterium crusticola]|uniref:Uncharacterized protein n=1 Tax=Methylobacterium crusticola TaxID=1697972 RepID=A0ABQ4QSI8_9HYPH|nr:hypothetical protein [Methylobacterium crusticola]GJD48268.1 hypothetical protein OPKNFCMD_0985 [Methylobacterium crusticola]